MLKKELGQRAAPLPGLLGCLPCLAPGRPGLCFWCLSLTAPPAGSETLQSTCGAGTRAWSQIPALPRGSCVILGRAVHSSGPFPFCKMGIIKEPASEGFWEDGVLSTDSKIITSLCYYHW